MQFRLHFPVTPSLDWVWFGDKQAESPLLLLDSFTNMDNLQNILLDTERRNNSVSVCKTYSEGTWALVWSRDRIYTFYNSVSFPTRGKCTLTQNKRVSETREFPSYSTLSNRFSKQSFANTRGCCDKRLSGCWFTSYKHFLLGLLTASYIHFWRSALQRAADLLIILKMSK